mgnify:CR=1 FL=1
MKKLSFFFLFMLLAGPVLAAEAFTLKSPQIKEGGALNHAQVFNGFGCSGGRSGVIVTRAAKEADVPYRA